LFDVVVRLGDRDHYVELLIGYGLKLALVALLSVWFLKDVDYPIDGPQIAVLKEVLGLFDFEFEFALDLVPGVDPVLDLLAVGIRLEISNDGLLC